MKGHGNTAALLRYVSASRLGLGLIVAVMSGIGWTAAKICIWLRYVPHSYFGYRK